ncbi:MAG: ROK family protein [Bacteroidales bacterium]
MDDKYYLGIDIGGTKCAVIAGRGNMDIIDKISFPTETKKGPCHAINLLLENAGLMSDKLGLKGLQSIGISCGGPLDSRKGLVQSPPNLPGWDNIPIVELFVEKFHVPAYLQNDANACALAEWKFGAGKGTENMIFLTFGTGMGAGIIVDGKLYSGTNDLAGEVGHVRLEDDGPEAYGKKGSFEGFCSGTGISMIAKKIVIEKLKRGERVSFCQDIENAGKLTTKDIADAAFRGDRTAIEIFEFSGKELGKGLSVLIDILNPQLIVIGSIYARCSQFLEPACMEVINRETLKLSRSVCRVVPAALGEQVGDFASLSIAICSDNGK